MPTHSARRRQLLLSAATLGATAAGLAVWRSDPPLPGSANAEPPLIGWLAPGVAQEAEVALAQFRDALSQQGLNDGVNVRIVWRFAEGRTERLDALVAELLDMRVRVLVALGNTTTQAARRATDRVPIVSVNGADPVSQGFAVSLARPGGNLTGVGASPGEGLYAKAAELLVDVVAGARRLAYMGQCRLAYMGNVGGTGSPHEAVAATTMQRGLEVLVIDTPVQADVEPGFERARAWGADLLLAQNVIPLNVPRRLLPDLALNAKLPAGSAFVQWVEAGFALAHDYDREAVTRRGAWYVARILEGAYPGDLPFERPIAFVVAANRTTFAQLGLTLPQHVALQVTHWFD